MATANDTALSASLAAQNAQERNVNTSYAIGLINNNARQSASDLTFSQRLSALQNKLDTENSQLPDRFAQRGLLNSGIYNYNGPVGTPFSAQGAKQQFLANNNTAISNLQAQQQNANSGFGQANASLGLAQDDQLGNIPGATAGDVTRQAIATAISGA